MISTLTAAQEKEIPNYLKRYLAIGLSTTPCDRVKAEAAITASYASLKLPTPSFIWADSPFQGRIIAAQLAAGREEVTQKEVSAQAALASYGSFDAYWVGLYAFIAEQLPVEKDGRVDIVKNIVENCGVYWTFDDVVVMTDKPTEIHMADAKLHNDTGLALAYKDGSGLFVINGVVHPSMVEAAIAAAANK